MALQEKRNKTLFTVLLLLSGITAVLAYVAMRGEPAVENKDLFQVKDTKTINRVELQSSSGMVALSFNGTRWMVNDREVADRDMIDVLFATLLQAEVKRPITGANNDSIVSVSKVNGVTVKLFEGEQLSKSFLVGGNDKKTAAYFIDQNNQAYLMHIPGYRVYVSGIFELDEAAWWDKYVFAFNWTNFKSLVAEYPNDERKGFSVSLEDGYFGIAGLATDTTKLNDFLDAVSLLTVDEYNTALIDSMSKQEPVFTIQVSDIASRTYTLSILPVVQTGKTACRVGQNKLAWIDNRKLARLVKNRDFFEKKP